MFFRMLSQLGPCSQVTLSQKHNQAKVWWKTRLSFDSKTKATLSWLIYALNQATLKVCSLEIGDFPYWIIWVMFCEKGA